MTSVHGFRGRPLGAPRASAGGAVQHFVDGDTGELATKCVHPIAGTWWVRGTIRDKWHETGAQTGRFGWPCEDASPTLLPGGALQHFAGEGDGRPGAIVGHPAWGTYMVYGAIHDAWLAAGGEHRLGLPQCDTMLCGDNRGAYNQYAAPDRSRIYWHPDHGAMLIPTPILAGWRTRLLHTGPLGYPVGPAEDRGDGLTMPFEHGTISVSASGELHIDQRAAARTPT